MLFKFFARKTIARQLISQTRTISSAASLPKRNLASQFLPVVGAVGGAIGFYAYSTQTKLQAESKRLLAGDDQWVDIKVKDSKDLSENSKLITFELPKDYVLGLHTASAVLTKFLNDNGKNVLRPYTPVSDPDQTDYFELVIKKYPGGAMSTHIHGLKPGDTLAFKGPLPKYKITPNLHNEIALLGGGTGITPLYQVLHEIVKSPEDKTKVTLFYASTSPNDILLKKEIDDLIAKKPDQLKVHYFVDKPDKDWKGETGFISKEFLEKNLFPASKENVKVFVCGPPPFYGALSGNKVSPTDQGELTGALKDLGFDKSQVFKF